MDVFKQEDGSIIIGKVIYVKNDYAFTFEPVQSTSYTILVNDLNISFNKDKYANQVWGYNSYRGWINKNLTIPIATKGKLVLTSDLDGITRLDGSKEWVSYFDSKKGWFCIGDEVCGLRDAAIEFASNTIAVLRDGNLRAVWLKPVFG